MYPYRAKGWNAHTWFSVSGSYIGTYGWAGSIEQEEISLRHQTRSIATLRFIAHPPRGSYVTPIESSVSASLYRTWG